MTKIRIGHSAYPLNSVNALVIVFSYKAAETLLKDRGFNISSIRKILIQVADGEYRMMNGKNGVVEIQLDYN